MKLLKKPWFIPILLTIVILLVSNLYTNHILSQDKPLPEQDVRKQLEEMYGGTVEKLTQLGSLYEAEISRDGGSYRAEVDAVTGKVLAMVQTKETNPLPSEEIPAPEPETIEPTPEEAEVPNNVLNEEVPQKMSSSKPANNAPPQQPEKHAKPEKTTVLITEAQAGKIALGQLKKGTIAEVDDVDYVKSTDGGYYLVKIDIDTDADLDEVTYQIHAISGKIMSVTWDD